MQPDVETIKPTEEEARLLDYIRRSDYSPEGVLAVLDRIRWGIPWHC